MADTQDFPGLIRRVQSGCSQAARELHELYGPHVERTVRRYLHQKLRSKFDSTDFVQDVWASFFVEAPEKRFETPQELVAFLTRMARNKVAEAVRTRMQRQKYNINRERPLQPSPTGSLPFAAVQPTPSEVLMGREAWDNLLQGLPLVHRRILLMLREGKSPDRIAEEIGVSRKTVSRVIRKAFPDEES